MKSRNANRGRVWSVLNAAARAWGLPGLADCVKVYYRHRVAYRKGGNALGEGTILKFDALGGCLPHQMAVHLQREWWAEDREDRNDTLVHELAHIAEYLLYGKCSHGKRHKRLMRSGLKAVKRLGIRA